MLSPLYGTPIDLLENFESMKAVWLCGGMNGESIRCSASAVQSKSVKKPTSNILFAKDLRISGRLKSRNNMGRIGKEMKRNNMK